MTVDPKVATIIHVVVAILGAIVGGTVSFTGILPDDVSAGVVKWSSFVLSLYGAVAAALDSISSPKAGPLANRL